MPDEPTWLRDAWIAWWIAATSGSSLQPQAFYQWGRRIIGAYAGSDRRYHGVGHLRAVLSDLLTVRDQCDDPLAVELALWTHDAVYDPARPDNEMQSAALAAEVAATVGWSPDRSQRTAALVLATRHGEAVTGDAAWVVDIDLGILGADAEAFLAYDQAIREEYGHVPDADFRIGRTRILQGFLARDEIYATPWWRTRREALARANLAQALEQMRDPIAREMLV